MDEQEKLARSVQERRNKIVDRERRMQASYATVLNALSAIAVARQRSGSGSGVKLDWAMNGLEKRIRMEEENISIKSNGVETGVP